MAATAIEYAPLTPIKLCGQLRQFGKSYQFCVRTPAEAIKALSVQIPGFERFLSNAKSRGLVFAVFRGKKNIGEKELGFQGKGEIIIAPVIVGSKRSGVLQTVVGALLISGVIFHVLGASSISRPIRIWRGYGRRGRDPDAQPPGWRLEDQRRTREHTRLSLLQRQEHHGFLQPVTALLRQAASGRVGGWAGGRVGGAIISAAIYAEDQI